GRARRSRSCNHKELRIRPLRQAHRERIRASSSHRRLLVCHRHPEGCGDRKCETAGRSALCRRARSERPIEPGAARAVQRERIKLMLSVVETFGPWVVCIACAALCYLLTGRKWTLSGTQVVILSLAWVALVQAEGIFPGPLSRL